MRTRHHTTGPHPVLALGLLSGSYGAPEDFEREGFVASVEARGIPAWIAMAEVRAAYFSDGTLVDRIRESVVEAARSQGLQRIWLAGVSLGGLACLSYAARHAADLERIVLISPYPGTREILREIDAAGGLEAWDPAQGEPDAEREAWAWLRSREGNEPRIDCYYGERDRFVDGQRRIASCLPRSAVHETAGGHEWEDWRGMWTDFLDRSAA